MMKRNLAALAALLTVALSPVTTNAASIVYDVNRTIGGGTVTGFVQTDGTLGVLSGANITDWSLTLTAPNLFSGSPSVINFAGGQTFLLGAATSATLTQLLFDFSILGNNIFLLQSANTFWCLETGGCTGAGAGEHMGRGLQNVAAQSVIHSGPIVLASVTAAVAPVPEPEIYAMMGLGLGLLGWIGRRKKLRDAAAA
jgi:hypothetical protein